MDQRFCENCGAPLKPGAKFCENCGQKIVNAAAADAADAGAAAADAAAGAAAAGAAAAGAAQEPAVSAVQEPASAPVEPYRPEPQQSYQQQSHQQQNYQQQGGKSSGGGLSPRIGAVLAYLFSLLGCLIFYLLCDRNDDFVKFHLNQALVLGIAQVIYQLLVRMDLPLVRLLGLFMFFAWIVGMYGAVMGKKVEIPLLSNIKII